MTLTYSPALKIDFHIGTHCEITFTRGEDRSPALTVRNPEFSQAKLGEYRQEVRDHLAVFRRAIGPQLRLPLAPVLEALRRLHSDGTLMLCALFGEAARTKLPDAIELCREACPGWSEPGWDPDSMAPNLILVTTSVGYGIPIDLLPLFGHFEAGPLTTMDDLRRLAAGFLGFSAVVKRELGVTIPDAMYLENIPRLPVKMFVNRSLDGALREEAYLKNSMHFDFDRSWPDGRAPSDSTEFSRALAGYLWEPSRGFSGNLRNPPDQIYHFSCHCDTLAPLAKDYTLSLQSGRSFGIGRQTVRLESLTSELLQLGMNNNADRRPRPLVFFNACGSGDMDPAGASSFPDLFVKKDLGFIGFVGTETTIPDEFASEFSQALYDHLLAGIPIGRAMHAARWKLLRSYRNPLGILYSLYTEPKIRVRSPVAALEQEFRHNAEPNQPNAIATTNGALTWLRRGLDLLWARLGVAR